METIKSRLKQNKILLRKHAECADLWVKRARLLMLEDEPLTGTLDDVEGCLLRALALSPKDLEAIEEAAHFYDVMVPNKRKAVMYAKRYIRFAGKVVSDMNAIIRQS